MVSIEGGTMKSKYTVGYVASIIAANWLTNQFGLVALGPIAVTAGTFAAGAALILRDGVQRTSGKRSVLYAIAVGAAVSFFTSSPALAAASGIAFLVSELVDFAVFTPLSNRLALAVVASSVVSAPVDTVLFLQIAGFGVTTAAVVGQFVVKTVLALAVAVWITCFTSREA